MRDNYSQNKAMQYNIIEAICGIRKIEKGYGKGWSSHTLSIAHRKHGLRSTRRSTNVPKGALPCTVLSNEGAKLHNWPEPGRGMCIDHKRRPPVLIQTLCCPALLLLYFPLLLLVLSTLYCLRQVLLFQDCVFLQRHDGNETAILFKKVLHLYFLRITSRGIT